MKKVLVTAIALFALCNIVFADLVIDMEFGTTDSTATQPNIGGTGNRTMGLVAGYTGPLYVWVYARVTNGPVTPAPAGLETALLGNAQGTITETSYGVYGDMTWGTSRSTNATRATYAYSAGYPAGYPDFSAGMLPIGQLNAYGDIDISNQNYPFGPTNPAGGVDTGGFTAWIPVGHFTYTVETGSAGTATITFHPDTRTTGALYQYIDTDFDEETGEPLLPPSNPFGGNSGYTTTGPLLLVGIPEPSTAALAAAGMVTLLLTAWLRRK